MALQEPPKGIASAASNPSLKYHVLTPYPLSAEALPFIHIFFRTLMARAEITFSEFF